MRRLSLLCALLAACSGGTGTPGSSAPGAAGSAGSGASSAGSSGSSGSGGSAGSSGSAAGVAGEAGTAGTTGGTAGAPTVERVGPVSEASYLVTVQTGGWNDTAGELALWRWENGWQSDGEKIPVMIGKSGLAWGRGLHGEGAPEGVSGPEKKEGDGRSPAGAFRLGTSYGYAASPPAGTQALYQAMTPTLQCIEDTKSAYYNQVVDRAVITPDWDSTDLLRRDDGLYEFIIFVEQNVGPAVPGRGSCILFHVWTGPTKPTAGCTSMERDNLERVVRSLAPQDSMVVQLPQGVYQQLREGWQLP